MGYLLLAVCFGVAIWVWMKVNSGKGGPSHCMGCGKCDKTGYCVLKEGKIGRNSEKKNDSH